MKLFLTLGLFVLVLPAAVYAQETETSAADDAAARGFFDAGSSAYAAGRYEVALAAFEQGYALSPRPGFVFNMATSLDRLFRTEESLAMYERYLPVMEAGNEDFVRRRIAFLTQQLERNTPPVEEPEPEPEPVVDEPEPEPLPETPEEPNAEGSGSAFLSVPALIGFGVGVAGLATFAVSGAISSSRFSERESTCAPGCSDDDVSPVRTTALIADIGLGVGIAGLAFGLIYGLVGGSDDDPDEVATRVSIEPSRGGAALRLQGAF